MPEKAVKILKGQEKSSVFQPGPVDRRIQPGHLPRTGARQILAMQRSHGNQYVQRMVNHKAPAGSLQREMFFENVAIIGDLNVTGKITEDFMPGQDMETGHGASSKQ